MSNSYEYKDLHDRYLSLQIMQMTVGNCNSNMDIIDSEDQQVDIQTLELKKEQLFETKDPYEAQDIIETIKNMISEVKYTAELLIENDFNSMFSFLLEMNSNVFYCSLYDLLSEIFEKYEGDIEEVVTNDILNFLNLIYDEDPFIFISNLKCILNLLKRKNKFKYFFIENGGLTKLINYNLHANTLEQIIIYVLDVISLIFDPQDDLPQEFVFTIEYQKCIFDKIISILQIEFRTFNVKVHAMICLDSFIRYCYELGSKYGDTKDKKEISFLLYDDEACEIIKNNVTKNLRFNNPFIISRCMDIMQVMLFINKFYLFDFDYIQSCIQVIFDAYRNVELPLLETFSFLITLADKISFNDLISNQIILNSIQFCDSNIYSVKSKSVHFLSVLIHMSSASRVLSIIEKYPIIIEIFCDFINSKEKIAERIISALSRIIELCLVKEFITEQKMKINIFRIYELIDMEYLIEFLFELESHNDENNLDLVFGSTLSGVRYIVSIYNQKIENHG